MGHILKGSGKGVDELMGKLGQETNGVHIQDSHVTWQPPSVNCDIQGGKELVLRLQASITRQGFDESGLAWTKDKSKDD